MITRKDLKRNAKHVFRRHYGLLLLGCLFVAVLGNEFKNSTTFVSIGVGVVEEEKIVSGTAMTTIHTSEVIERVLQDGIAAGKQEAEEIKESEIAESTRAGASRILGHSRGVLANIVNSVTSGSVFITLLSAANTLVHSSDVAIILFILACAGVMLAAWYFVKNTLAVVLRRISLECRTYEKVPVSRFIFLLRVRRWCRVAGDMFVLAFFKFLWNLTVIGGIIKRYSYRMVPFILAENPDLKAREAITLSRRIMKGHKWECFILDVTFWGWDILGILTLGISNVFFLNPYKICTFSEYYTELRRLGIENEIEGFEAFCDVYLYEKAPKDVLEKSYADIEELIEKNKLPIEERKGVLRFLADVFGIVLVLDDTEKQREESHERRLKISSYKDFIEGRAYPNRLFVIPEKKKVANAENISYLRCYSLASLVLLFFGFSFIGWLWEVSLHVVKDGMFINRGVLHGPWLPIYGAGGVLILVVLKKLREYPPVEFVAGMLLCGCVEYVSSYYLQVAHNGKKWWDYSGYFLNLNGRICAEGVLVFGLGGMGIVYVLAPLMDNVIRKIKLQILIPICVILLGVFVADNIYSLKHPNAGKGITDYRQIQYQGSMVGLDRKEEKNDCNTFITTIYYI
ncbi:MAG: DUF975 family protein [Hespellia sp.]|nr:DUF975 family protein [Hespellia sp.]